MKTKYKILIALTLIVVFGLGAAAGVLGERYFMHKRYRRSDAPPAHAPSLESWTRHLQLTPDQQEKIREIFKRNEVRMKTYQTEVHSRLGDIRKMLKKEIDAVLTPEQIKKMDEMFRQYGERRKNAPDRNPPRDRRPQGDPPPDRKR